MRGGVPSAPSVGRACDPAALPLFPNASHQRHLERTVTAPDRFADPIQPLPTPPDTMRWASSPPDTSLAVRLFRQQGVGGMSSGIRWAWRVARRVARWILAPPPLPQGDDKPIGAHLRDWRTGCSAVLHLGVGGCCCTLSPVATGPLGSQPGPSLLLWNQEATCREARTQRQALTCSGRHESNVWGTRADTLLHDSAGCRPSGSDPRPLDSGSGGAPGLYPPRPGNRLKGGGGPPSPLPHCTAPTPKAFPYPNTSLNRFSNRQKPPLQPAFTSAVTALQPLWDCSDGSPPLQAKPCPRRLSTRTRCFTPGTVVCGSRTVDP